MTDTYLNLITSLEAQLAGNAGAIDRIRSIVDSICGEKVFRDSELTPQQIRGLELVLSEWREMFSFDPGRSEGLLPLIALVNSICRNPTIEQMEIYARPEWKELVSLRGPVESVLIYDCDACHTKYPRMGTSGFLDVLDFNCPECGGIVFKSAYSNQTDVVCVCGSIAKLGCPKCGSLKGQVAKEMSPYEYFMSHQMLREDAS